MIKALLLDAVVEPGRQQAEVEALVSSARPVSTGLALLLSDTISLLAACWLGTQGWTLVRGSIGDAGFLTIWPASGVFLLAYALQGLYPGVGLSPVEELRRLVRSTTMVCLALTAALFLVKDSAAYSRGVFLSFWVLAVTLAPLSRAAVRHRFAAKPWWGVPVVVLGAGRTARVLVESLRAQPGIGLKPVACLDDDANKQGECAGIPVAGGVNRSVELARRFGIRHALVAMPGVGRERLSEVLQRCGPAFSHMILIPDLFGVASLWVSPKEIGGVLGLEVRQNLLIPANRYLKKVMDMALGLCFGLASIPAVAIAALWIKRIDAGPAFYKQKREGEGGRLIDVWKLRTMRVDGDMLLLRHLQGDPDARDEWERYFKLKKDPRILPGIGTLLRQTSLDELPQLWNILKGEMSLVGPRPFPVYHLEHFSERFRSLRAQVTPGLTGLWQVSARSDGDLKVQETLDTYYIRNWSPWLDLYILARTVKAVLQRSGAY